MKKQIKIFLFIILIIVVVAVIIYMSGDKYVSPGIEYVCPDMDKLRYDESNDIYYRWENCMPHPGVNDNPLCGEEGRSKYEQWVNENCNIKFELRIAW